MAAKSMRQTKLAVIKSLVVQLSYKKCLYLKGVISPLNPFHCCPFQSPLVRRRRLTGRSESQRIPEVTYSVGEKRESWDHRDRTRRQHVSYEPGDGACWGKTSCGKSDRSRRRQTSFLGLFFGCFWIPPARSLYPQVGHWRWKMSPPFLLPRLSVQPWGPFRWKDHRKLHPIHQNPDGGISQHSPARLR